MYFVWNLSLLFYWYILFCTSEKLFIDSKHGTLCTTMISVWIELKYYLENFHFVCTCIFQLVMRIFFSSIPKVYFLVLITYKWSKLGLWFDLVRVYNETKCRPSEFGFGYTWKVSYPRARLSNVTRKHQQKHFLVHCNRRKEWNSSIYKISIWQVRSDLLIILPSFLTTGKLDPISHYSMYIARSLIKKGTVVFSIVP